ncbi:MAG: pyridoxamine 5'-phosphate oxidase family protein [Firmicutes bacterium]|nr:pyridoxamine 5'-phosphate oxidase family protein [Bacillota bacterium]
MTKTIAKEKVLKLHKKVKTFILTCVSDGGYPLTKAVVATKHRESLDEIYFCTNTSSKFALAVMQNSKGSVYFYSRKIFLWKGCFLKGDFEIVSKIETKKKFWDARFKNAYEEKSFTDPDFCVLRFKPIAGRFYSNFTIEDFDI